MRWALPALVLLLAGCGSHRGTIAFTSTRDGNAEVYAMRADGGGQSLFLTRAAEAAYSPDGTRLASLGRPSTRGAWALYVGRRRVSHATGSVDSLAWSPDGDRLAFVAARNLYVVDADGNDERRLTHGPGSSLSPRWSADGKSIAVERLRGQHSDVVVVRADGAGERALTSGSGKNGGPTWRP